MKEFQKPRDIQDYVKNFLFWTKMRLRAKRGTIQKMTNQEVKSFLNSVLYNFGVPLDWRKFILLFKHGDAIIRSWGSCKFDDIRDGKSEYVIVAFWNRRDGSFRFVLFQLVNNKLSISDLDKKPEDTKVFTRA